MSSEANHPTLRPWGWIAVSAVLLLTAIYVLPNGADMFRAPKEYVARGGAFLAGGAVLIALLHGRIGFERRFWRRPAFCIPAAVIAWTAIATALSTNRLLSVHTLTWVVAMAVLFWATLLFARGRGIDAFIPAAAAGTINAVVYTLQELKIWNPFPRNEAHAIWGEHIFSSALLGNPDDAACYFVPVGLMLAALALQGVRRPITIPLAVLIGVVIGISQTVTAIGAYTLAMLVLAFRRSPRRGLQFAAAAVVLVTIAISVYAPMRRRAATLWTGVRTGHLDLIISSRTPAFTAAVEMFTDRPVAGQGPGTFHWAYLPYKLRVEEKYPNLGLLDAASRSFNFGEVHNDHLEILAEAGLGGYVLFGVALVTLAAVSFRRKTARGHDELVATHTARDETLQFARSFALPFAVAVATITLAQFPLQLASTTTLYLHLAALCLAWGER